MEGIIIISKYFNYTVQMLIDDLMEFNPNAKIINTVEIGWNTTDNCEGKKEAEYIAINYAGEKG